MVVGNDDGGPAADDLDSGGRRGERWRAADGDGGRPTTMAEVDDGRRTMKRMAAEADDVK